MTRQTIRFVELMSKPHTIPRNYEAASFISAISDLGFTYERCNHGLKITHSSLSGSYVVSCHANGNNGRVSVKAMRMFAMVLKELEIIK